MKITKMYKGNYQRNGVCGEGFYSCLIDWKDGKEGGRGFLATFTVHFNGDEEPFKDRIKTTTCRIVNLNNLQNDWRGDNFGVAIEDFLRSKTSNFYEYIKGLK